MDSLNDNAAYREIAQLMPPGYKWFIAGGYAANPALACDIDVWVLVRPELLEAVRQVILKRARLFAESANPSVGVFEEDSTEEAKANYAGEIPLVIKKVATVKGFGVKPIHIMVTTAKSPDVVIDNFDISTHMVAIWPNGTVVKGRKWSPTTEPPTIVREGGARTFERWEKLMRRYAPSSDWWPKGGPQLVGLVGFEGDEEIPF